MKIQTIRYPNRKSGMIEAELRDPGRTSSGETYQSSICGTDRNIYNGSFSGVEFPITQLGHEGGAQL